MKYPFSPPAAAATAVLLVALSSPVAPPVAAADNPHCPPLGPPPAEDQIVNVTEAEAANLPSIVGSAAPHTTILLADGTYDIESNLTFTGPYVTLRSASGNRDAVVLDGQYRTSAAELIRISSDHVTVADLTIQQVWDHPVHIVGGGHYATLYNLRIVDGRQQFVKVNNEDESYADFGLAACNELDLTSAGRQFIHDNPTPGFLCYTGGFDLHQTWDWVIRDNTVKDIHCTNGGLAEHAIHFFQSNRDPIVERNLLLNNARAVGFGLGTHAFRRNYPDDPFAGTEMEGREDEVMQIGGIIQNNFIHAAIGEHYDSGVSLESAWKPLVRHNTIYSAEGGFNSAIDVRFPGSVSVVLSNNLFYPRITVRGDAPIPEENTNVMATADMFAGLGAGDLHLVATASMAIDQGIDTGLVDDFDGNPRDTLPDVGADEYTDINTSPSVTIGSPPDGSIFDATTAVDFSATAFDIQEGDLTSSLAWTSGLDGPIGNGGAVTTLLSPGLHLIHAQVVDSGGLPGWDEIDVGVTSATCPESLVLHDVSVTSPVTERAVLDITAGPNVTVESSGELHLQAGRTIAVGDGFVVHAGGTLGATLTRNPCG